tara:strand:+ start:87 stop:686 length:600 start_codon:yes stop_codon:yes gene_type:complete
MNNVSKSWKDSNVFLKQLELNLKELSSIRNYPTHWIDFIELIKTNNPASILDIGCGCGAIFELCRYHFENMKYFGLDYSENAIILAKKTWDTNSFDVMDYKSLTKDYISEFDLLHLGALLDVLPNGDEALEYILSITPKSVLITRMKFTEKESYYETYKAYDEITTCAYYHNKTNFLNLCEKYGYAVSHLNNNFYLNKK